MRESPMTPLSIEDEIARVKRELIDGRYNLIPATATPNAPAKTDEQHLRWMLGELFGGRVTDPRKFGEWMGFVAGVLAARGQMNVDAERERTRPLYQQLEALFPAARAGVPTEFPDGLQALREETETYIHTGGRSPATRTCFQIMRDLLLALASASLLRAPEAAPGWQPKKDTPCVNHRLEGHGGASIEGSWFKMTCQDCGAVFEQSAGSALFLLSAAPKGDES